MTSVQTIIIIIATINNAAVIMGETTVWYVLRFIIPWHTLHDVVYKLR